MTEFGVIPIIKPVGITSFKVIHILRKITGIKKIGHTGTLDPFATGLLPVCIGKATRIAARLTGKNKEYIVTMQLGIKTDSGDNTGKTISTIDTPTISIEQLAALKKQILSITSQKPPIYSAIKVNGKRAYELARKDLHVDLPERPIRVLEFEILEYKHPEIRYKVFVSKGTYIRSLSETIAEMLGTIGTTIFLDRTKIAGIDFSRPVHLEKLNNENWRNFLIPIPQLLPDIPRIEIEKIDDFKHGRIFAVGIEDTEEILVLDNAENFLGFGKISEGLLHPVKVFV